MEPYTEYRKDKIENHHILYCTQCRCKVGHQTARMLTLEEYDEITYLGNLRQNGQYATYLEPDYAIVRHECDHCHSQTYDYVKIQKGSATIQISAPDTRPTIEHGACTFYRIYPPQSPSNIPPPNDDMSETCRQYYEEAVQVFPYSPRAAAALIRLGLQTFLQELGTLGHGINAQIAHLVGQGLAEELRQGLDYCRVVGNEAVHPGTIDLNDNRDMALFLFVCFNMLVSELVTKKKQMKTFHDMLPAHLRAAADKRDGRQAGENEQTNGQKNH